MDAQSTSPGPSVIESLEAKVTLLKERLEAVMEDRLRQRMRAEAAEAELEEWRSGKRWTELPR